MLEVEIVWEYLPAQGEWVQARMAAARAEADRELRERGAAKQLQAIQDICKRMAAGERGELPDQNSEVGKTAVLWDDLRRKAYDRFSVPQPDWDAPTTDSLEAEVRAFVKRVAEAIRKGL